MPDVISVRTLGPPDSEREGTGLTLKVGTRVFGLPLVDDIVRITGLAPPRRLTIIHAGIVKGWAEWRLDGRDGNTTTGFLWRENVHLWPPILGDMALRIYWLWQRRVFRRAIENVRSLVEGAGSAPSQVNRRKRTMPWGNPPELRRTKRRHKRLQVG